MIAKYLSIAGLFLFAAGLNQLAPFILDRITTLDGVESTIGITLWCLSLFMGFGWACSKLAAGTVFPNFTLQLLAGVILHDALSPLASQLQLAVVVCTAFAAIILKGGGDEIDRRHFGKIIMPTLLIAIPGYLITFIVMYLLMSGIGLDGKTSALLAAIICSTDPAALIPTLKALVFKAQHKHLGDLAIAESAINDTLGAIVTTAIAGMIIAGIPIATTTGLLHGLIDPGVLMQLGKQFLFGTLAGLFGWGCMQGYEHLQSPGPQNKKGELSYDFAFVIAVPLLAFLLAITLHGNGYLAAFLTGLLSNYNHAADKFHSTLHTMEIKIESIGKPVIFMMVGPFVSIGDLVSTFWMGLMVAAGFMLVARPLAVLLSLLPTRLTLSEKWFLCAVRETGVIPVVLAVITVVQFPHLTLLMPLTAWTVIWTLGLLPALTPWWAGKLGLLQK